MVNLQQKNLPQLMDKVLFHCIQCRIMHEAIGLILQELDLAKGWAESIAHGISFGKEDTLILEPDEKGYTLNCKMPIQYELPCRYWLYSCVVDKISISFLYIHL